MSTSRWKQHELATHERLARVHGRKRVAYQVGLPSGRIMDHTVFSRLGGVSKIAESKAKGTLTQADVDQILDYQAEVESETGDEVSLEFHVEDRTRVSEAVLDRLSEHGIGLRWPDEPRVTDMSRVMAAGLGSAALGAHLFRDDEGNPSHRAALVCGLLGALLTVSILD